MRKIDQVQIWNCVRPCYLNGLAVACVASGIFMITSSDAAKIAMGLLAVFELGSSLGVLYLASKIDRECFEAIKESEDRL